MDKLLLSKDLELEITLKELYNITKINLYIYSTDINKSCKEEQLTEFSHFSHPDLQLKEAIKRSCAFPIIFKPILDEESCYVDGGIFANTPIQPCLDNLETDNTDKVLVFNTAGIMGTHLIDNNTGLFSYVLGIIRALIDSQQPDINIKNVINFDLADLLKNENDETEKSTEAFYIWKLVTTNKEFRQKCYQSGINYAKKFIGSAEETL